MKAIIPLSAITVLATLVLVGCNQNPPASPIVTPATNSIMNRAGNINTNLPITNSVPNLQTNMASDDV
jgi:type IV pilus biogenesis protein CpaD/CtpE